jgi:hypothetical protein
MSTLAKKHSPPASHSQDFYTWALETAGAIRDGRFEGVDWEAVAEELEDMGRSERRALESRLEVLLSHLIKWRYQPERRSSSWTGTMKEQHRKAARLLHQNPGLRPLLGELIADAYTTATALAERDTGMDESRFPTVCPWSPEQVLDEGFLPS